MALTIQTEQLAVKYETKQTGLTYDEAAEAAVLGYRVRCSTIPANAFIHYEFDGLRIQFIHDGKLGSSSGWQVNRAEQLDDWQIVPLPSEVKRDAWGKPIVETIKAPLPAGVEDTPEVRARADAWVRSRDSWGRPIA